MQVHPFLLKITGELTAGNSRDQTVAHFARLFSLSPEKAHALLTQGPRVIREGLDSVLAERYQAALSHIGIKSVIECGATVSHNVVVIQNELFDTTVTPQSRTGSE